MADQPGRTGADQIICMHDYGYYNWIGTEAGFSGVIDWDMAGPGVPLDDIAFTAWNTAPLGCRETRPTRRLGCA